MAGCLAALRGEAFATPAVELDTELRSHGGAHGLRFGVAVGQRADRVRGVLIVDPWYFIDEQITTDLLARVPLPATLELNVGLRNQAVSLADGMRLYESLLIGVAAPLRVRVGAMQFNAGMQLTTLLVSHGAGLPTQWYSLSRGTSNLEAYSFELLVQGRYAL